MTDINFYHLTASPMGKALPKLLEKVVTSGMRAVVVAENDNRVEELNKELWTYTTKFFLPHGSKADGYESEQPVFLTSGNDNPNGSEILVFVENTEPQFEFSSFKKCLYMFSGENQSQVEKARLRWKLYKDAGHNLTYWQQDKKGAWQQGAS